MAGKEISSDAEIKRTTTKLTGYGGAEIPVKGTCVLPCSYQTQEIMAVFYIVELKLITEQFSVWKHASN
jgi:hypothetical protein